MAPRRVALGLFVASLAAAACGANDAGTAGQSADLTARSWRAHPAIVEMDDADDVYAVSDIHGHDVMFASLLAGNHLIDAPNDDPKKIKWTGGSAILVVAGDLIDKGPHSIEVIDLLRALQTAAAHGGGRVVVTMGNHEAEFLADPHNKNAKSTGEDEIGIDVELASLDIEPESLGTARDPGGRGAWLASLPFGVRIKKWFFAHGGNTSRLSVADLESKLEHSVDHHGWDDKDITGNDSILEAQGWYGHDDDNAGAKEADALGVKHIVFGHDPGALDDQGRLRVSKSGVLFKLDTNMGIHDSSGIGRAYLLHITTRGTDTAEALDEHGSAKSLL